MRTIKNFMFIMPLSFIYLFAYDAEHAKDMYDSAKCSECHDKSHYTREDRKVQNYKELHKQVDACRYSTNADWFDEDRDDVVKYLNDEYYKF